MQFNNISLALAILYLSKAGLSAPIPQGAGVGAGCDAILSDADTGSGLAVKEGLTNAANTLKSAGAKARRQGAGVGAACNSILTDADTGSGLALKYGLTNAANELSSLKSGVPARRQLDKAGAGTAAVITLVSPTTANTQEGITNNIDSEGTNGSAELGQETGTEEVTLGTTAGNLVPGGSGNGGNTGGNSPPPPPPHKSRRQLDKAGAGTAAVIGLVSPQLANTQEGITNNIDSQGTNGSAELGQEIGSEEVTLGTTIGNSVPGGSGNGGTGNAPPPKNGPPPPPPPHKL